MSKIAILGDTHFDVSNSSELVYAQQIKFFKEQFFPYLKENNIKEFIQLGDFFDVKTKVGTFIQFRLMQDFFDVLEKEDITMHYFVGNHDLYFKDSREIYSLAVFEKAYRKNFKVYQNMDIVKFGKMNTLLVPWMYDHEKPKLMDFVQEFKPDLILGHFEIQDFSVTKDFQATHGLDKEIFKGIPVISGHFHLQQNVGNIFYLGTPYQTSWSDYNERKGFLVLDTETQERTFIENTISTKHLMISLDSEAKEMVVEGFIESILVAKLTKEVDYSIFKNNNVKISIDKDNAFNKKIIEKIIEQCNKYKVRMSFIESESGEVQEQEAIKESTFVEYDVTSSIAERLSTDYQKETFNKVHQETLKQIEEY